MEYLNAAQLSMKRLVSTVTYVAAYLSWATVTAVFWVSGATGQYHDEGPMPPPPPRFDVTTKSETSGDERDKNSWQDELPWWWWIAVVAGSSVAVVLLLSLCVCLCCRRRRRRRSKLEETEGANKDISPSSQGVSLRRLDSTTAKRYLHNLVSVFSWGSDFNDAVHDESRRVTPTPSPRSSQHPSATGHVYVNPDALGIEGRDVSGGQAPPRPPRKNEVNQYLNVSYPHRRQLSHEP